jgi:hypothetical protein
VLVSSPSSHQLALALTRHLRNSDRAVTVMPCCLPDLVVGSIGTTANSSSEAGDAALLERTFSSVSSSRVHTVIYLPAMHAAADAAPVVATTLARLALLTRRLSASKEGGASVSASPRLIVHVSALGLACAPGIPAAAAASAAVLALAVAWGGEEALLAPDVGGGAARSAVALVAADCPPPVHAIGIFAAGCKACTAGSGAPADLSTAATGSCVIGRRTAGDSECATCQRRRRWYGCWKAASIDLDRIAGAITTAAVGDDMQALVLPVGRRAGLLALCRHLPASWTAYVWRWVVAAAVDVPFALSERRASMRAAWRWMGSNNDTTSRGT